MPGGKSIARNLEAEFHFALLKPTWKGIRRDYKTGLLEWIKKKVEIYAGKGPDHDRKR